MIDTGRISSFILWGPPGVGKTTLAQIIAHRLETPILHAERGNKWCEGCPRGDRKGSEQPFLYPGQSDSFH